LQFGIAVVVVRAVADPWVLRGGEGAAVVGTCRGSGLIVVVEAEDSSTRERFVAVDDLRDGESFEAGSAVGPGLVALPLGFTSAATPGSPSVSWPGSGWTAPVVVGDPPPGDPAEVDRESEVAPSPISVRSWNRAQPRITPAAKIKSPPISSFGH